MKENEEFSQDIARARALGYDAIAADCLLISDDASGDFRLGEKSVLVDTDHIQRAKLRIETRLKLLAKWDPKRYGEKVAVTGGDPETDNPIQISDRDRAKALATLVAKAKKGG